MKKLALTMLPVLGAVMAGSVLATVHENRQKEQWRPLINLAELVRSGDYLAAARAQDADHAAVARDLKLLAEIKTGTLAHYRQKVWGKAIDGDKPTICAYARRVASAYYYDICQGAAPERLMEELRNDFNFCEGLPTQIYCSD